MKQLFILGVGRTGSKFYMQLLNTHKNIFISPELMFRHPIKKDFYTLLNTSIKEGDSVQIIVDKLFNFKERLPFTRIITKIGKEKLTQGILNIRKLTPYSIFDCIIKLSANHEKKSIYGAKFPIHYKYMAELIEYFEDSKILFLTRDPRAIYASDLKKKKKESKGEYYRFRVKYFIRFFVLFYTIIEWKMSMITYKKCLNKYGSNNIKLFKYENIINNNDDVIKEISLLINCSTSDFIEEDVLIVDSSYNSGISADRWMTTINVFEKFIFKLLIGSEMKSYGYN